LPLLIVNTPDLINSQDIGRFYAELANSIGKDPATARVLINRNMHLPFTSFDAYHIRKINGDTEQLNASLQQKLGEINGWQHTDMLKLTEVPATHWFRKDIPLSHTVAVRSAPEHRDILYPSIVVKIKNDISAEDAKAMAQLVSYSLNEASLDEKTPSMNGSRLLIIQNQQEPNITINMLASQRGKAEANNIKGALLDIFKGYGPRAVNSNFLSEKNVALGGKVLANMIG